MAIIERGTICNGAIALDNPLPLPDGSKVLVKVEVQPATQSQNQQGNVVPDFAALPFFGLWADRTDMVDSAEYVRQERAKWQHRPYRQD